MRYLKSVLAGCSAFVLAFAAFAQGTSTTEPSTPSGSSGSGATTSGATSGASSGASSDAFVDCRKQVAEAKSAYRAGKIDKQEYEREKKAAQDKLMASGTRGAAEKNLECE